MQAIGVGLVAFWLTPFDSFMKSQRMSQTDSKCESSGRFHKVVDTIGKRRNSRLALNFEGLAQAIGVGLVAFRIYPFKRFMKSQKYVTNGHQMRKLWPFSPAG